MQVAEPSSREIDARALGELLEALDPDRAKAALRYEALRAKLVDLFRWRGLPAPEDLTDETLHRVGRRLIEGEVPRDVARYAAGVARLVALEAERGARRFIQYETGQTAHPGRDSDPEAEARWQCFEQCLAELPDNARDLLLRYDRGSGAARIAERRELAAELGIPLNALRIRVHRLRMRLEQRWTEAVARLSPGSYR